MKSRRWRSTWKLRKRRADAAGSDAGPLVGSPASLSQEPGPLTPAFVTRSVGSRADDAKYGLLQSEIRAFLDALAGAAPDPAEIENLKDEIGRLTDRLRDVQVEEAEQFFGRVNAVPFRGQSMTPAFVPTSSSSVRLEGTAEFGRWFLGSGGAAHGGAIALLFDEVVGLLASGGPRGLTRTAYLTVQYQELTPISTPLTVVAWVVREEGRKRFLRAELRNIDTVCATAEGLFILVPHH